MIKYEEKTFIVIDYIEIRDLINKTFNVDFVCSEVRNDSYYNLGTMEIDKECEEEKDFMGGEYPSMIFTWIQLLVNRGLIKPGSYLLRVYW